MFAVATGLSPLPMSMKLPPGTINRRYPRIWDSLIPFNCEEFTFVYFTCWSFRIVSKAFTSLGEDPVPLNKRTSAASPDFGGVEAVSLEAFVLVADVPPSSFRTPQPVKVHEPRSREATRRIPDILPRL